MNTPTTSEPEKPAPIRSTDGLESTTASATAKWIQGEISLGKLLNTLGCSRPSGDDLAGSIRNYYEEGIRQVMRELERKATKSQLEFQDAEKRNHKDDMTADAALTHAYTDAQSVLRLHLGHAL